MNIFICWSGDRGERLAHVLRRWLPIFIPRLKGEGTNLFVSADIAKGTRWFDEVEKELDRADAGLVCVTREALQSGWIHFEAGALARAVRKNEVPGEGRGSTLYTYLLGVQPGELKGPLAEYQSTTFDREDTKKFCAAIVGTLREHGSDMDDWERAFDKHWPKFADQVKQIGPLPAATLIPDFEEIFRRKTFNEPIEECMRQAWIDRFTGARETIAGLETYRPIMTADNSYLLDLYNDLLAELDAYAMNMGALLLTEKKFQLDEVEGKLRIGKGIRTACERRRGKIRQIVTHLLSPNCAPVREMESRRYAKMDSVEARKALVIDPAEREIRDELTMDVKHRKATDADLTKCARSLWEFDRIFYYLWQEHSDTPQAGSLVESLEQELERARAAHGGAGLVPLQYGVRALKKLEQTARPDFAALSTTVRALLERVERFLGDAGFDDSDQLRGDIKQCQQLLDGCVCHPVASVASAAVGGSDGAWSVGLPGS